MNAPRITISFAFLFIGALVTLAQDPSPRLAISASESSMTIRMQELPGTNDSTIESSTNLIDWTSLGDFLGVNAESVMTDHERHSRRFYRGIWRGGNIQKGLDRNRAKWESRGIMDYQFAFRWICFCTPDYVRPVVIFVRDGEIATVRLSEDGTPLKDSEFERYPTVDGLFDFLQEAIDLNAESISAYFHPRYGFPRRAQVDYNRFLADEERGFVVSDFRLGRAVPEVQLTDRSPKEIQLDSFSLGGAVVDGNTLTLTVSYSGGCRVHEVQLFMSPAAFLESSPVQANLYVRHNADGDLCEAWITRELHFDLTPIAELYREQYGRMDPIDLNVFEYFEDAPGRSIQVRYLDE